MLKAGIVGLPNVGKSTLFNALVANAQAQAANFPFCTIEPNVGSVSVPDHRLNLLGDLSNSKQIIPTRMEFVDIAGLVKGASKGEGLGNKFLANIREVDAIVHVIRCFSDDDVIHVSGSVDPSRDIEIINLELALSDLNQIEKRRIRLKKQISTSKEAKLEDEVLEKLSDALENEKAVRSISLTDEEKKLIINFMNEESTKSFQDDLFTALNLFNNHEWYEAHDAFEEIWNSVDGDERQVIQGILQVSVSQFHLSKGNLNGATFLLGEGLGRIKTRSKINLGIDLESFCQCLEDLLRKLQYREILNENDKPFLKTL